MLRRSIAVLVICAGILAVLWPALAMIVQSSRVTGGEVLLMHEPWILTVRTLAWSVGIAIGAMLLGWLPGHVLGIGLHRQRHASLDPGRSKALGWPVLLGAILLPLLVPSYAVFYAWWQTWPSGTWLFDRLELWDAIGLGRRFTLGVALLSWSWPLVSLCVAPAAATWPQSRSDQLAADGASWIQRTVARLHHDVGGLLLGGLLVTAFIFGNVICFDLAGVFTVGNELRALTAMQAAPGQMAAVALPAAIAALIGAVITWWALGRTVDDASTAGDSTKPVAGVLVALIWIVTAFVPAVLIFANIDQKALDLWVAHGQSIARDAIHAVILGGLVCIVFLGILWLLRGPRCGWRWVGVVLSIPWVAMLLAPGSLVAATVLAGIALLPSTGLRTWLLGSGAALLIGWLAKFGGIAALAARWVARSEPVPLQDLRRMHGGGWRAEGPRTWFTAVGLAAVTALLALGEIPIAMRLSPPAPSPPVSVTLLNAMHYQRPETVIAMLALFIVIGAIIAIGLGFLARWSLQRVRSAGSYAAMVLLLIPMIYQVGCSDRGSGTAPLEVEKVIGGPGRMAGRFDYPRAMAVDPRTHDIFVVEKSGRVQRLDSTGQPLNDWMMPRVERGRPTGITIGPDGNVWIADTHEHRVMVYTPNGDLLRSFGNYGFEPGQFIYPTDVAFGPDGLVYVAEYGGNDRIQAFTQEGEWVRTLGGPGPEPGQFDRPQSIIMTPGGHSILVADARNRRIQEIDVMTGAGRVVRQGGPDQPLCIPFGLMAGRNGTLVVTDIGSNSLLRLDSQGSLIGKRGGWARGPCQHRDPWAETKNDRG
ncbi:MAG: hypothetical protein VX527_05165, partial [Planctomycetota bacterium]|nr:hypothetical protein [Planctomycetota bacterium]